MVAPRNGYKYIYKFSDRHVIHSKVQKQVPSLENTNDSASMAIQTW